jgi:molybdopterin synthase sulfur carrier subunit
VIRVKIYTIMALKEILGQRELEISIPEGSTIQDLISRMVERWGDRLSSYLFQPRSDRPLSHIRLMVNGRDIEFLNGMETVLQEGDEFMMLPLVSGG